MSTASRFLVVRGEKGLGGLIDKALEDFGLLVFLVLLEFFFLGADDLFEVVDFMFETFNRVDSLSKTIRVIYTRTYSH